MRSLILWAGLVLVTSFVPLLGGPRYEAALVAGLIGPFWSGVASQRRCEARFSALSSVTGEHLVKVALTVGLAHVAVLLLVASIWGAVTSYCEPWVGFGLLALGPGMGMVLAAFLGAGAAVILSPVRNVRVRRFAGAALAMAPPLFAVLVGLWNFYESPSVFAYSPFVGHFAGPLYDTVTYDLEKLSGYRGGTLLSCLALAGLMSMVHVERRDDGLRRLRFSERTWERFALAPCAALATLGSLAHASLSDEMGYRSSTASIRADLGRSLAKGPCRVFFSRGVDELEAAQIADECVGHLGQLAGYFELESAGKVDVYVFSGESEKKRLMGAGSTYIAKPWRREIYIQPAGFPHPVLGHELAHVVTEAFGVGPFRIAGHLGGFLPDPGRIEGFAEAASPKEHSEGTLHEWTAAMQKLDLLPPLSSLFQLSFLGSSPAKAYAASGSFVDFVRQRSGAEALRRWYSGEDLSAVAGASWSELEKEWHDFLSSIQVSERVLEIAQPRFSRPGVFERRCPHAVDRLTAQAVELCPYQEAKARRLAGEAIALDGTKKDLELRMARCAFYQGDGDRSRRELLAGAQNESLYDPAARRGAFEFAGNIAWAQGGSEEARKAFEAAQELTFDIDGTRNLEVKLWALAQPDATQRPLRQLLAPRPRERRVPQLDLSRWMEEGPHPQLARYLLARTLFQSHAEEADLLVDALSIDELPLRSLELEAGRMKVLSGCRKALRSGKREHLDGLLDLLAKRNPHAALKLEAKRVVERCDLTLAASEAKK